MEDLKIVLPDAVVGWGEGKTYLCKKKRKKKLKWS